jgi:hypothetical protein
MLRDGKLSRLYLTMRHRLLGGEHFDTMTQGPGLRHRGHLALRALYLDAGEQPGNEQSFAQFEPVGG